MSFTAIQVIVFAQSYPRLDLKNRTVNLNMRYPAKFIAHNPKKIDENDSSIILSNKDTLFRYKIQKLSLLKSDSSARNQILILLGVSRENIPLIVVDENFNKVFSDDSVHQYPPSKNMAEFFRNLPQISISVDQNQDNINSGKKFASLTLAPEIQGTLLLNDSTEISQTETIALSFYSTFYLGANIIVDGRTFEICVIPHPLAVPVLKDSNVVNGFSRWGFNVYELRKGKRDSLLYFNFLAKVIDNLNDTATAFSVLDKYVLVTDFSLDSSFIGLNVIDSNSYYQYKNTNKTLDEKFDSFKAFNLNTQTNETYFFANEKLTLLEFSGSWCLPCKEVLPDVKALHEKYGNKVNFVTILEEQNLPNAEKYFKENKLLGQTYYENINEIVSFKNKLEVSVYPGFFLIDNNGAIILHTNSSKGLVQIENEIKNQLLQNKQSGKSD